MAASVLNSVRAVEVSRYVVRAFVQQRELLAALNKEVAMTLTPHGTYFLVGYLDGKCLVPFMQTLVYLSSATNDGIEEHTFADAIAWYRNGQQEDDLEPEDTLLIADGDLDTIKDFRGLLDELATRGSG